MIFISQVCIGYVEFAYLLEERQLKENKFSLPV